MRKSVIFLLVAYDHRISLFGMSYIRTEQVLTSVWWFPMVLLHFRGLWTWVSLQCRSHFFPNINLDSGDERPGVDETCFEMAINGDVRYYFPVPKRITVRLWGNGGGGI